MTDQEVDFLAVMIHELIDIVLIAVIALVVKRRKRNKTKQ